MSIIFDPKTFAEAIVPARKIRRMLTGKMNLKRAAMTFATGVSEAEDISIKLDKKAITNVARKTIDAYKARMANAAVEAGLASEAASEVKEEILDDPKLLVNRVQNEVIFQVHEKIKDEYAGQRARWLPSDAAEPRPEHQANYGKVYIIGEGIDGVEPGDEYGCQCGVEILTNETEINLG